MNWFKRLFRAKPKYEYDAGALFGTMDWDAYDKLKHLEDERQMASIRKVVEEVLAERDSLNLKRDYDDAVIVDESGGCCVTRCAKCGNVLSRTWGED